MAANEAAAATPSTTCARHIRGYVDEKNQDPSNRVALIRIRRKRIGGCITGAGMVLRLS